MNVRTGYLGGPEDVSELFPIIFRFRQEDKTRRFYPCFHLIDRRL
jgi:hypothetical protein